MAELALEITTEGQREAIRLYAQLDAEQKKAFASATGLRDVHKELGKAGGAAARDIEQGWKGIVGQFGLALTAGTAVVAMLAKAKEGFEQLKAYQEGAARGQESFSQAFQHLRQSPQMLAAGAGGAGQADALRRFALEQGKRGGGSPAEIMQAITAAVGTGAAPERVQEAVAAAVSQKQLTPDTDLGGFATAVIRGRQAGFGATGARNLAVMAGPGGAGVLGRVRAVSAATGIGMTDLMAMQEVIGSELGESPEQVLGTIERAMPQLKKHGVKMEDLLSGNLSPAAQQILARSGRMQEYVGALRTGAGRFAGAREQYAAAAAGGRDVQAEGFGGLKTEELDALSGRGVAGEKAVREIADTDASAAANAKARRKAINAGRTFDPGGDLGAWLSPQSGEFRAQMMLGNLAQKTLARTDFLGLAAAIYVPIVAAIEKHADSTRPPVKINNEPDTAGR